MKSNSTQTESSRPPVIVVMGHIDHGKSTLLDYIRKTNIVDTESGGITQHLSAYQAHITGEDGKERKITFIDTPGHEAFTGMRERGASAADIAVLVVSAEDSVKAQTIEAVRAIKEAGLPYVVAINKIDRPGANPLKVKTDLAEHDVMIEEYGGDVPAVEISAKTGAGIPALLELLAIIGEMKGFSGNPSAPATGLVIESHLDGKRGISATLLVKNGTLEKGMFVLAGTALATTRIMEHVGGKPAETIHMSEPVQIVGFDELPSAGMEFNSYHKKNDAIEEATSRKQARQKTVAVTPNTQTEETVLIPLIAKSDAAGTLEAVLYEISKLNTPEIGFKIIGSGIGDIGENDAKLAISDKNTVVVGFRSKIDAKTREILEQNSIFHETFDIIYKLSERLTAIRDERKPKVHREIVNGKTKVLKVFSKVRDRQIIGGRVLEGKLEVGNTCSVNRRDNKIASGTIVGLEQGKQRTRDVAEGVECGIQIECKTEIAPGDILESFEVVYE